MLSNFMSPRDLVLFPILNRQDADQERFLLTLLDERIDELRHLLGCNASLGNALVVVEQNPPDFSEVVQCFLDTPTSPLIAADALSVKAFRRCTLSQIRVTAESNTPGAPISFQRVLLELDSGRHFLEGLLHPFIFSARRCGFVHQPHLVNRLNFFRRVFFKNDHFRLFRGSVFDFFWLFVRLFLFSSNKNISFLLHFF